MATRFAWPALLVAALVLATSSRVFGAESFETPADEPPGASLSAAQVSGPNFHVVNPVHSDGLMRDYVIDSHFGVFNAYGLDALNSRLREIAALTTLENTSDGQVAVESAVRSLREQARLVFHVATHPIGTVLGIPKGIGHLLGGYRAQAQEVTTSVAHSFTSSGSSQAKGSGDGALERVGTTATHQAERYLGLSAAEQRWYAKLGVDPYTDNIVLRRAVARMAKVDAAASFGMKFAPVGIPFAGEVEQALNAVDREDPAVLRKRRRESLSRAGLTPTEITRFEHTPLLTPTRQTLLVNAVDALNGVQGRGELLRHAMSLQTEDETQVFLQSTLLLQRYQARHPVERILAGVRIPAAQLPDGHVAVFGAFDAVLWTRQVAVYEQSLSQELPPGAPREVWVTGTVSARARAALEERGCMVHASANTELGYPTP